MTQDRQCHIDMGPLIFEQFSASRRAQALEEVSTAGNCCHLLFNHGVPRLLPGPARRMLNTAESVMLDESIFARFIAGRTLGVAHWQIPMPWILERIPALRPILGQPLRGPCRWRVALNAFLAQLTPEVIHKGPVNPASIAEQIRTLLALVTEAASPEPFPHCWKNDLHERIRGQLAERCGNADLTISDIARSLGVSPRTLQRALAARGESFGDLLLRARVELSTRMLESPNLRQLPIVEIGKRAGFKDPSHFGRVFRRVHGMSPAAARRATTTPKPRLQEPDLRR
jgi:AraC-like DNA-binding protein